jgi:hypothetical protein
MTREEAKKMLTNTKVYVNGKSKEIQEKLFEIGFEWNGCSGNKISHLSCPFLFIRNTITKDDNMVTFANSELKEVSADYILNIKIDEEFNLKDGDIFYSTDEGGTYWISIFNRIEDKYIYNYIDFCLNSRRLYLNKNYQPFGILVNAHEMRLATDEEKNKLFSALKEKGYVWNEKTKEVEDIKQSNKEHEFKPFDKVLVRDFGEDNWDIDFFQEIVGEDIDYKYICLSNEWNLCIPYEGNEYLLGTSNSPK